jgi:hypothetical protein
MASTINAADIKRAYMRTKQLIAVNAHHHEEKKLWLWLIDQLMFDILEWPTDEWIPSPTSPAETLKETFYNADHGGLGGHVYLLIGGGKVDLQIAINHEDEYELRLFRKKVGSARLDDPASVEKALMDMAHAIHDHVQKYQNY